VENFHDYLRPWQLVPILLLFLAWLAGGGYLLASRYRKYAQQRRPQVAKGVMAAAVGGAAAMIGGGVLFLLTHTIGAAAGADLRIFALFPGAIGAFFTASLVFFAYYDIPFVAALKIAVVPMGAIILLSAIVGIAMFLPVRSEVVETRNKDWSRQQLQIIDTIVRRSPTVPTSIQDMIDNGQISTEVLTLHAHPDKPVGFFYLSVPSVERGISTTTLRACEFSHRFSASGRTVLFANGECRWVPDDEFQALLNDPANETFKNHFTKADWQ